MSLLTIDVGNTNLVFGVFDNGALSVSCRLTTLPDQTADELWVLVDRLFTERGVNSSAINGVVLSSVVPSLTHTVSEMVANGLGIEVMVVDSENVGLQIRCENPAEVGADRLANAVAALSLFEKPQRPIIVVDFGTATTFDAISASGEFQGGVICPGVEISADALFHRAARLPRVEVCKPTSVIGRTTVASMQSGLFYGYVAMVEGIMLRLRDELRVDGEVLCVATGGLADTIASETNIFNEVCPDLTLVGLRFVWERNQ